MRREGLIEFARRAATLALLVVALVTTFKDLRHPDWLSGVLWVAFAVAVYVLIPRPSAPDSALCHEALPATIMPDVLGFLLGTTFFGLPLLLVYNEPTLQGVWIIALIMWALGLFALAILYLAARHACTWVDLGKDQIVIADLWRVQDLPFADIAEVRAVERKLPAWVGPALVLFGGIRGAGVALLHADRAAHSIVFQRKSDGEVTLPVDAFPGLGRVIKALQQAGVRLDDTLQRSALKVSGRRNRRGKGR